ncbi:unnamed protein product, partial [Effrenium voratum]
LPLGLGMVPAPSILRSVGLGRMHRLTVKSLRWSKQISTSSGMGAQAAAAKKEPAVRTAVWCVPHVPGVDEELATVDLWHALLEPEASRSSGARLRRWCCRAQQLQAQKALERARPQVWCNPLEEEGDPWAALIE